MMPHIPTPAPSIQELRRATAEDVDSMAAAYQAGANLQHIAAKVGRSYGWVRHQLLAAGVVMRKQNNGGSQDDAPVRPTSALRLEDQVLLIRQHTERVLERVNVLRLTRWARPLSRSDLRAMQLEAEP